VVFWRREFAMRQIFGSLTLVDEMVGPTLLFVSVGVSNRTRGRFCDGKKTSTWKFRELSLSGYTYGNLLNGVWSEEKYGWQCGSNVHGIDLSGLAGG
jgi:hypothetical protein